MDIAKWLVDQRTVISSAPVTFLTTVVVVWIAASKFTRATLGDEAAAAKVRFEDAQQKLSEVEADKTQLISKLQVHGEDIKNIKQDLAKRPPIHVGADAPKNPQVGDVWIDTSSTNDSRKR